MRVLLAAALLAAATLPAFADQTGGTVAAFDAATNTLTLTDKTVWILPKDTVLPEGTAPGDRVEIVYTSAADNGWVKITRIARVKA